MPHPARAFLRQRQIVCGQPSYASRFQFLAAGFDDGAAQPRRRSKARHLPRASAEVAAGVFLHNGVEPSRTIGAAANEHPRNKDGFEAAPIAALIADFFVSRHRPYTVKNQRVTMAQKIGFGMTARTALRKCGRRQCAFKRA